MIDALPTFFAGVDDTAVASNKTFLICNHGGREQKVTQHRLVLFGGCLQTCERLLGDDENMDGSLGFDVSEGQAAVVFIDDVSRDVAADYPGKNRFLSHPGSFSQTRVTRLSEFA
jgi:hypothetical protein